jgi:hypothetical protein
MIYFNRLTIVSACSVLGEFLSHSDLELLETEWGISGRFDTSSKPSRAAGLANVILSEDVEVLTESGCMPLSRAVVERAILAPLLKQQGDSWRKLIAGLRMDGFEIGKIEVETDTDARSSWPTRVIAAAAKPILRRMYPDDVPSLQFKEAENEILALLRKHSFSTSDGHLSQALAAFSRGDWASANGQFRTFFQSYLEEICSKLGGEPGQDAKQTRDALGKLSPPFLLERFNEWSDDDKKSQFLRGLWQRLQTEGSHPGLSEEDDCTFRLHITLITARLILRRFDQRP